MSQPDLPPLTFAGLGITEISRTACELLEWKRPSGGLKNSECRRLIEQLAGQSLLRRARAAAGGAHGARRIDGGGVRLGR